jgi:DNA polymerase delta subunit 1
VDSILIKRDVMGARVEARRVVSDLLQGRIPIEKLTLSKALRTGYKNLDLPHLAVARKMEQRDPGSGPKPGDRVRYVLLDTGNPTDKQSVKAEDPAYAVEHGLPLDMSYYLVCLTYRQRSRATSVVDCTPQMNTSRRHFGSSLYVS